MTSSARTLLGAPALCILSEEAEERALAELLSKTDSLRTIGERLGLDAAHCAGVEAMHRNPATIASYFATVDETSRTRIVLLLHEYVYQLHVTMSEHFLNLAIQRVYQKRCRLFDDAHKMLHAMRERDRVERLFHEKTCCTCTPL